MKNLSMVVLLAVACAAGSAADAGDELVTHSAGESLARAKGCMRCHDVKEYKGGPSFRDVARINRETPYIDPVLKDKVQMGTLMHWKSAPWPGAMPPAAARGTPLTDDEAQALTAWILGLE